MDLRGYVKVTLLYDQSGAAVSSRAQKDVDSCVKCEARVE